MLWLPVRTGKTRSTFIRRRLQGLLDGNVQILDDRLVDGHPLQHLKELIVNLVQVGLRTPCFALDIDDMGQKRTQRDGKRAGTVLRNVFEVQLLGLGRNSRREAFRAVAHCNVSTDVALWRTSRHWIGRFLLAARTDRLSAWRDGKKVAPIDGQTDKV